MREPVAHEDPRRSRLARHGGAQHSDGSGAHYRYCVAYLYRHQLQGMDNHGYRLD
jgi:hypothetical protein